MATHIMSYAVTGAMAVGDTLAPHVLVCQHVQLVAACAFGEVGAYQSDMTFQHKREIVFHFGGNGFFVTHPYGAGDIGSAVQVLSAGVQQ